MLYSDVVAEPTGVLEVDRGGEALLVLHQALLTLHPPPGG